MFLGRVELEKTPADKKRPDRLGRSRKWTSNLLEK